MTLSRFSSRTLALGLVGLIMAALFNVAVVPLAAVVGDALATLAADQDMADRYRHMSAQEPDVVRRQQALAALRRTDPAFLSAPDPAIAGATLQQWMRTTADQAGATVNNLHILDPVDEGGLIRIALRVRIEGTLAALAATVHAIEANRPVLVVHSAELAPARPRTGGAITEEDPVLTLAIEIHGFAPPP